MTVCPCCGHKINANGIQALSMINMGRQERAIIGELSRVFPRGVTNERMQAVLYADRDDGGANYADKVVSIVIMRVRRKIEAFGWTIPDGRTEGGYRLIRSVR